MKNLSQRTYATLIDAGYIPTEIQQMTATDIIDGVLRWHGLIGFTAQIEELVKEAYVVTEKPLEQPERERLVAKTLELTANALQTAINTNGGIMPAEFALTIEPRAVVEHLKTIEQKAAMWDTHVTGQRREETHRGQRTH